MFGLQYCAQHSNVIYMVAEEIIASHRQELKRGTAALASLSLLAAEADYGYNLIGRLAEVGIEIEANTLYPLLRRLEKQGLLTSDWDTTEARPRKFYSTSEDGISLIEILRKDWDAMTTVITAIGGK